MRNILLCVLCLASCTPEETTTTTLLAHEIRLPLDPVAQELLGRDFDKDGDIDGTDNALRSALSALESLAIDLDALTANAVNQGSVLIALDITTTNAGRDRQVSVDAYFAQIEGGGAPAFDGGDVIEVIDETLFSFPEADIQDGLLTSGEGAFFFPFPFDSGAAVLLPMQNVEIRGDINPEDGTLRDGVITGTINALDFARNLGALSSIVTERVEVAAEKFAQTTGQPAPVPCGSAAECVFGDVEGFCTDRNADGDATGVCILDGEPPSLAFEITDPDRDGVIEVVFDEASGTFLSNDLASLFDLIPGASRPAGAFGTLFQLDFDNDGFHESMGIGFGFETVRAVRSDAP